MKFEISLAGPRRTLLVQQIIDGAHSDKLAHYDETSSVRIVNQDEVLTGTVADGPRPNLEVLGIAGIDRALAKLNDFLSDFSDDHEEGLNWDQPSCGIIVHGTHGTGKSLILQKIADSGWGKVFRIDRETKAAAYHDTFRDAKQGQPSIILLDNLDAVISKEQNKSQGLDEILGDEMDHLAPFKVLVVAAVPSLNDVPRNLMKRGRFVTDILLPVPNADCRKEILKSMAPKNLPKMELLDRLGERTHAYTPEDLGHLLDRACIYGRQRIRKAKATGDVVEPTLTQEDIEEALIAVRPSAMYDVTLQPPKVRWHEIGGQDAVKKALRYAVEAPRLVSPTQ